MLFDAEKSSSKECIVKRVPAMSCLSFTGVALGVIVTTLSVSSFKRLLRMLQKSSSNVTNVRDECIDWSCRQVIIYRGPEITFC